MAKKSKISIRKVLQVALTLVAAICCIVAMVSASRIEEKKTLKGVEVQIAHAKKYHFIEEKQVLDEAINKRNIDIVNTPIGALDMQGMETALKNDPWVADAQLFVDNAKVLHIGVTQRYPVARIFEQGGHSYYIDSTLHTMPLTPDFVFYTAAVTNVPILGNDSVGMSIKAQLVKIVREIQIDSFWNAQVSQIIVDSGISFELIPVLGDQRIIFGDTSRIREKLDDLYAFYRNVLNRIGWEHYETLDVRFKGQVVAAPALPYSGPVDKAVANMNWVNSIIETEARRDSLKEAADARITGKKSEKKEEAKEAGKKDDEKKKKDEGKKKEEKKDDKKSDPKKSKKTDKEEPSRKAAPKHEDNKAKQTKPKHD